jgi:hypothetical protein
LVHRPRQKISDPEACCLPREVLTIEAVGLNQDDSNNVAPLPIGRLASHPIPPQCLEQDVFRGMNVQPNRRVLADKYYDSALEDVVVDCGAAGDKEIHFD